MAFGKPLSFLGLFTVASLPGRGRGGSSNKEVKLDRDEVSHSSDEMAVAEVGVGCWPLADNGVQGDGCEDKTANLADLIWTLMTSTISRAHHQHGPAIESSPGSSGISHC